MKYSYLKTIRKEVSLYKEDDLQRELKLRVKKGAIFLPLFFEYCFITWRYYKTLQAHLNPKQQAHAGAS